VRTRKHGVGDSIGELTVTRLGYHMYCWCKCPDGHEELRNMNDLRRSVKLGKPIRCRLCAKAEPEAAE
jgi:hypothetical protein